MTELTGAAYYIDNMKAAVAEIEAIEDDGSYVLMVPSCALFFCATAPMAVGFQWATRYTRRQATVTGVPNVTNGNGEQFRPTRLAVAKAAAILDLQKAIKGFEEVLAKQEG